MKVVEIYDPIIEPRMSDSLYGRFFRLLLPGTYTVEIIKDDVVLAIFENVEVEEDTLTYLDIQVSTEELFSGKKDLEVTVNPNPFSASVTFEYELKQPGMVSIEIYNQFGKMVDVIEQTKQQGINKVIWSSGNLPGGIYYFRLHAEEQMASGKMILLR